MVLIHKLVETRLLLLTSSGEVRDALNILQFEMFLVILNILKDKSELVLS